MQRRAVLAGAAGLALAGRALAQPAPWNAGPIAHLLPTVSHDRLLLKLSLQEPVVDAPSLLVDGRPTPGQRTDLAGAHWQFDVVALEPSRRYTLALADAAGRPLGDAWPIATFPAPGDQPVRLRVLFYTCAGGHERIGRQIPIATRVRLLERALSFAPDAVVANGDHVYWDQRTRAAAIYADSPTAVAIAGGHFRRDLPVLGPGPNEPMLKRVVGPQIVPLYGTRLRSTPVFFLQDDHDYFENDEADDRFISFPPDPFMLAAGRASQRLYYPEFLPDAGRPAGLGGGTAPDRPPGTAESFGTLRYGRLAEVLLYDCRRYMTQHGPSAVFVPGETETWLKARMAQGETAHLVNAPSTPPGWSAGKWGEWYADIEANAALTTARPKPYWQPGWRAQHDRLLAAAAAMPDRLPLFISGDLHALGETRIARTGEHDLSRNPVISVLSGPLGTGDEGYPSAFRGMVPKTPAGLTVDEVQPPIEENGFTLVDFTPEDVTLRYFRWRREPLEAIDMLQPFRTTRYARG